MTHPIARLVETRRKNLRRLADQHGASALADLLGHSNPSYMSQMIGPNPTRVVSERTAREIEWHLGIEPGSLDLDFDDATA